MAAGGGLILVWVALVVYDSSAPLLEARATVISKSFLPGSTSTTSIHAGEGVDVPVTTTVPGAWQIVIDSPALGRQEVAVDEANLEPGEEVWVEYYVGRLSHSPAVVEVRLQPRAFT